MPQVQDKSGIEHINQFLGKHKREAAFTRELSLLINKYEQSEHRSIPDFMLASYLRGTLMLLTDTMQKLRAWQGIQADALEDMEFEQRTSQEDERRNGDEDEAEDDEEYKGNGRRHKNKHQRDAHDEN